MAFALDRVQEGPGLPFDPKKAQLMCTSRPLGKRILAMRGRAGGELVELAKKLGMDATLKMRKRGWGRVARHRWTCNRVRVRKLRILVRVARAAGGRVYTAGFVAAATYAAELTGMPTRRIRTMRKERLELDRLYIPFADIGVQCSLERPAADPGWRIASAPLLRYAREVWLSSLPDKGADRPEDVLSLRELNRAFEDARALELGISKLHLDVLAPESLHIAGRVAQVFI